MNEQDLRDCFAMFAMVGKIIREGAGNLVAEDVWNIADEMVKARKTEPEVEEGIVAVKPKRKTK